MIAYSLREWRKNDAVLLAKYANNANIAANLRNAFPYPYTVPDAVSFIDMALSSDQSRNLFLCIDIGGAPVGGIGAFQKDDVYCKTAEIGYWLAEKHWGAGIISDAVPKVCEMAFAKFDIVRIEAGVFAKNYGSRRVLEKNGFVLEGIQKNSVYKNGELQDCAMYALFIK